MQCRGSSAIFRTAPLLLVIATAASGPLQAQTGAANPAAPVVPGYEHLRLAGAADEAALGELLLGELNCLSCHEPAPALARRIPVRAAPDLDRIAERATGRWLTDYLMAPHVQKPGSAMPEVLHSLAPDDREDAVRNLVGYLAHRGSRSANSGRPEQRDGTPDVPVAGEVLGDFPVHRFQATVERGRRLFRSVGCVACHSPGGDGDGDGDGDPPAIPSVPLPDLEAKTSAAALAEFLLDPHAVRPAGRMPPLHLAREEAEDIAVYLLRGQAPLVAERRRGFEFEYYLDPERDEDVPGFFDRPAPDLDALRPAAVGRIATLSLDLPVPMNDGNHAFRFSGLLRLSAAGAYTFTLASDRRSGASLRIGDAIIATKPPFSRRETEVAAELEAGDHPVEVTYFLRGSTGRPLVDVRVEGAALPAPTPLHELTSHRSVRLRPAGRAGGGRQAVRGGRKRPLRPLRLRFMPHLARRRSGARPVLLRHPRQGPGARRARPGQGACATRHARGEHVAAVPAGRPPEAGAPGRARSAVETAFDDPRLDHPAGRERNTAAVAARAGRTAGRTPARGRDRPRDGQLQLLRLPPAPGRAASRSAGRTPSAPPISGSSATRTWATRDGCRRHSTAPAAS